MIFNATKLIHDYMTGEGIPHQLEDLRFLSAVRCSLPVEGGKEVPLFFISSDGDNDVGVSVLLAEDIPEEREEAVYRVLHDLTAEERYFRFTLRDGSLEMGYDFPYRLPDDAVGAVAADLLERAQESLRRLYAPVIAAAGEPVPRVTEEVSRNLLEMLTPFPMPEEE